MPKRARIGLLPLYLELYDRIMPEARERFEPLLNEVEAGFRDRGVDVVRTDICRLEAEVEAAVEAVETAGVNAIVTLHLAYSPSLEAIEPLTDTALPILMLDTTMDHDFGMEVDASRIMTNHGIHGVQDLASMLRRFNKSFQIVAGHVSQSTVMDRAARIAKAALAASLFSETKALRLGPAFPGMGDFSVEEDLLEHELGITVDQIVPDDLTADIEAVTEAQVRAEMERDAQRFEVEAPPDVHARSVRVGLGLRRLLEREEYNAFSANFLAFDSPDRAAKVMPFLEASKAMARGIGYAGEGDVLTAALVGALAAAFGATTFTEIFCPDWKGGTLFLSHMGEINPDIIAGKPLLTEKPYPFSAALNPAIITGAPAAGPAILVNLAPGPGDSFGIIAAPVESLGDTDNPSLRGSVRGWIKPSCELESFLEAYSLNGGTHHSALIMGDCLEGVTAFADFLGMEVAVL